MSCKIKIVLDKHGKVISVENVQSSGNDYFDRAAMAAVKKASPLPVPKDTHIEKLFRVFIMKFKPTEII